jgi:outer membrane protein assembly factor BamD
VAALLGGCFWKGKGTETEATAQQVYEEGVALIKRNRFEEAREVFNRVKVMGADPSVERLAQVAVADSYFEEKEYEAARVQYEEIFKLHSGGSLADYLQYRIGDCYFWQMGTVDRDSSSAKKGLATFNRFVRDFPQSPYASSARLRIQTIKAFLAENEFHVGQFYLGKKAYFAAINRFKKALALYPDSGISDKLVYYLYRAYKSLRDEDHAEQYRQQLIEEYPHSEFIPMVAAREESALFRNTLPSAAEAPAWRPAHRLIVLAMGPGDSAPAGSEEIWPEGRAAWEEVPPGLAGTYRAADRNAWHRRLLLLGEKDETTRCVPCLPEIPPDEKERFLTRSLSEKIFPW